MRPAARVTDGAKLANTIPETHGGVDILFLNAGVARFAPLEAFDEAFYDDMMDTNVKGALFTLQRVLPLLRTQGSVLLTTSIVNGKGIANASVYSATKGALSALMRSLAVETRWPAWLCSWPQTRLRTSLAQKSRWMVAFWRRDRLRRSTTNDSQA
jgi:NAD(P)-dependent dehydrogenase (short-subunit alcohol dehydrogenase family)